MGLKMRDRDGQRPHEAGGNVVVEQRDNLKGVRFNQSILYAHMMFSIKIMKKI